MWATSELFNAALHESSRKWATKIEVMYGTDVVHTGNNIVGGYIGIDGVAVRRELHVSFVDADGTLTPSSARDLLAPKGTEMRVWRGLYIPQLDDYEWVPQGVFGIIKPQVRSHSEGVILSIKGFDRVDAVRQRRFTEPWVVKSGTLVTKAITDIVASRIDVPTRIAASAHTTPELIFDRLSSPWDAVRTLAGNAAMVAYFDQLGSLTIAPSEGVQTGSIYTIGTQDATLMNVTREIDATETYSGVIVRGENPDQTTFTVEKWDEDPKSPTYHLGPFGRRPFGYYSEMITTIEQATAVANALFAHRVKMRDEAEITTLGSIAHDVDDIITIIDPRSRTSGKYRIISGTIPLRVEQGEHLRWRCIRSD